MSVVDVMVEVITSVDVTLEPVMVSVIETSWEVSFCPREIR